MGTTIAERVAKRAKKKPKSTSELEVTRLMNIGFSNGRYNPKSIHERDIYRLKCMIQVDKDLLFYSLMEIFAIFVVYKEEDYESAKKFYNKLSILMRPMTKRIGDFDYVFASKEFISKEETNSVISWLDSLSIPKEEMAKFNDEF